MQETAVDGYYIPARMSQYSATGNSCFGRRAQLSGSPGPSEAGSGSPDPNAGSVPEVPSSREDHRQTVLVGGGDHFLVPHGAARLDDGGRAGGRHRVEAVAEREERVRRGDRSREQVGRIASAFIRATFTASTRLIWPAPIASVRSAP